MYASSFFTTLVVIPILVSAGVIPPPAITTISVDTRSNHVGRSYVKDINAFRHIKRQAGSTGTGGSGSGSGSDDDTIGGNEDSGVDTTESAVTQTRTTPTTTRAQPTTTDEPSASPSASEEEASRRPSGSGKASATSMSAFPTITLAKPKPTSIALNGMLREGDAIPSTCSQGCADTFARIE